MKKARRDFRILAGAAFFAITSLIFRVSSAQEVPASPGPTEQLLEIGTVVVHFNRGTGKGILTPTKTFHANVDGDKNGLCYYVDYSITFSDASHDEGSVFWPICYTSNRDPFLNHTKNFALPRPQPSWNPTEAQWTIIAQHRLLRLYFPQRFMDAVPTPAPGP